MEKDVTIKVKITEGFANETLVGPLGSLKIDDRTFDEKADLVVAKFMDPLYRAIARYATKEARQQAEAQIKQAEAYALEQAKTLVEITKDETDIQPEN